ncbi:hypothetical protein HK104_002242, partial [Borealophlyctis nickersoniae]
MPFGELGSIARGSLTGNATTTTATQVGMLDNEMVMRLNYGFTILGLLLQIGNIVYATNHALRRPTVFNLVLLIALILYACSFIPLLMTTSLTIDLDGITEDAGNAYLFKRLDVLVRIYTALFGLSSLMYLVLVQIRFRVVKSLMPYKNYWDWIFVGVTVSICIVTTFLFGVIIPKNAILQSIASAIWSLYALTVDNVLSFIFIRQLYKTRRNLNTIGASQRKAWTRVVVALCGLCSITWVCLALLVTGNLFFKEQHSTRTFMFRLAYAFTPLEFSAALVFIYT